MRLRKKTESLLDSLTEKHRLGELNTVPICQWCKEEVLADEESKIKLDSGKLHEDCAIRLFTGSVGHQLKKCSCYGGSEEDPIGLTARQAAKKAAEHFRSTFYQRTE